MKRVLFIFGGICLLLFMAKDAMAAPLIPNVNVSVGTAETPQDVAASLQVMAVLTIVSLAPAILIMTTSFVRIVVVIGFLRNALSTQNVPPNQVVVALSLFLTFYIMSPYWSQANEQGIQPYLNGQITQETLAGLLGGIPGMLLGIVLGNYLEPKIPDKAFLRIIYIVMLVSGIVMIL